MTSLEGWDSAIELRPRRNSEINQMCIRDRCTRVPFTMCGAGGSGRRSMTEKRKARAQSLKELTLDGDRERGTGRAIGAEATPCLLYTSRCV